MFATGKKLSYAARITIFLYLVLISTFAFTNRIIATRLRALSSARNSLFLSAPTVDTLSGEPRVPIGALGPPQVLQALKIGEELKAFRQSTNHLQPMVNFTIERMSYAPDAFVIRGFLSVDDCEAIKRDATAMNMARAETITSGDLSSRKKCDVSWIPSGPNGLPVVSSMVQSTANIFLSEHFKSDPDAGVEDLQVLKYDVGGEFVLHHDGEPRVLTVIYYVNGVGGTWFPLARTSEDIEKDPCIGMDEDGVSEAFMQTRANGNGNFSRSTPQNKAEALQLGQDFKPGTHGLLIKGSNNELHTDDGNSHVAWINCGDALAFYNYLDDGSAQLNWRALHTGLPTSEDDGEKWIANHWFGSQTLR